MKFKFTVNTGDILQKVNPEMADKMPTNVAIDIEAECTLEELKGLYDLQKDAIKEVPELLEGFFEKFATVVPAFNKFDTAVSGMINGSTTVASDTEVSEE